MYIFGGNTDLTAEQIAQRRQMADAMLGRAAAPQNVGEGIFSAASSIAAGLMKREANKADRENREAYEGGPREALMRALMGRQGQAPTGSMAPAARAPSPQQREAEALGDQAMDALDLPRQQPQRFSGDRQAFIEAMMPHAMRVSQQTGLDPRLVIAQAAQETGWGKHAPNNNFFGIKSHGKSGGGTFATTEYVDGKPVRINDSFRGYGSMSESADGYAQFLQRNPRYGEMLAAPDLQGQLAALGRSGYATDPNYATSVGAIANSIPLPSGGGAATGGAPAFPAQAPAPQVSGEQVVAAMEVLNSAYASDADRAMAQMILQRAQPPSQMEQLELQRAQIEIEQMRNPPQETQVINDQLVGPDGRVIGDYRTPEGPDPTTTQREYEQAVSQGYQGTLMDYQQAVAEARRPQTNVTVEGAQAPEAPRYLYGAANGMQAGWRFDTLNDRAERIPGGEADVEAQQAVEAGQRASQNAAENESTRRDVVLETTGKVRGLLEERGGLNLPEAGIWGDRLNRWGLNQEAADVGGYLQTLQGMVVFDRLERLREASASGASGLGQVTNVEIGLLGAQLGALDQRLSPDVILQTMDTIENVFGKMSPEALAYLTGESDTFPSGAGAPSPAPSTDAPASPRPAAAGGAVPQTREQFIAHPGVIAEARRQGVTPEAMWNILQESR